MKSSIFQGRARPAFNFFNLESFYAIKRAVDELQAAGGLSVKAAGKQQAPVIYVASESAIKYMGDDFLAFLARKYPLHLDHGRTLESVKHAINLGFKSVMIDGSGLSFEENVKLTKAAVKYAHARKVLVEAELGVLEKGSATDPILAKKFVMLTGCDALAIAIGTSHGAYKGTAKLRFDVLSKIHKLLPKTPLVMHGASTVPQKYSKILGIKDASGIAESDIKKAVSLGIRKVNINTDSRLAWTATMKRLFTKKITEIDPRFYLTEATKEVVELYKRLIKLIAFSSKTRADSESN